MNKKRMKKYLIISLVILECLTLTLTMKSYSNRELSNLVEENKVDKKKFSMYIENDTGNYEEYTTSEIFPVGYKLNLDKSSCTDTNGNIVEGMLSSIDSKVTITSNKTTYCYLYFDLEPIISNLCTSGENLGSCLSENTNKIESLSDNVEGGMYRYQGTNDIVTDNYICFGTTDSSECTSNTDTYMYRIIGVNESGQLKLIKKDAFGSTMEWNSSEGVFWKSSELYSNLNGSTFYTNTTYVPTNWNFKIANTTWKNGSITDINMTAAELYSAESNLSSSVTDRIGLLQLSDYYYASQSNGLNCSLSENYSTCKTSWIHITNNSSGVMFAISEWTMLSYTSSYAWSISSNTGALSRSIDITNANYVRPVFYLNADEIYISGDGTIDNPIMLNEPELPKAGNYILNLQTTGLNTTMEADLYRYQGKSSNNYICFGTSDKSTCTGNTDAHMYRIIGINSSGQLKLIKNEALNTAYAWNSSDGASWNNASIYTNLNSSYFYSNTTYVPTAWQSKIATTTWKYGDITTYNSTADSVYATENGWTDKINAKIGLMYMHDYYYAYQSGGLNCDESYSSCKKAWIHLNNCDSGAPSEHEWTIPRYDSYGSWFISSVGSATWGNMSQNSNSVRPVFYLTTDVQFIDGTGTSSNPFIIQ